MRRRLFISHTLTVIVALVALLLTSSGVIRIVNDQYQRRLQSVEIEQLEQAQELLMDYAGSQDWEVLDEKLKELGYNLYVYVTADGQEGYSSLERFQGRMFQEFFASQSWPAGSVLTVQNEGFGVSGCQSGAYSVVAMRRPNMPFVFGDQRSRGEMMLIALGVSGIVTIVIIVLLSLFFTSRQIKRVMRPANALTEAAKRIEIGDYSQPVAYEGKDEFTAVCAAFDQMQEHLIREQKKNLAYEQARTDLVAGISHDLRTPLTSVKGYLKGLQDGVANTPEKQKEYLDIAYRRACDMDMLLQRLFYFSKLETASLPLFLKDTDLGIFTEGFVRDAAGEVEQQGGEMTLQVLPCPHPVKIDVEQMYRVLGNLTANALCYAGAKPLKIALTVWREEDQEHIRFADNGTGVSEAQIPHLFEQFWRGDQARQNRGGNGSGLGLYIVKYIVEAHGGTVTAYNDNGLVFEITLPSNQEVCL